KDDGGLLPGGARRGAWLEARQQRHDVESPVFAPTGGQAGQPRAQGDPDVDGVHAGAGEPGRSDADDREAPLIEDDLASQGRGARRELALPESMAQDRDVEAA